MKRNPPRTRPSRLMAEIRATHDLTVKQAWKVYRIVRDLLDAPLSLRKLVRYADTIQATAHDVAPSRVALPAVLAPVAKVSRLRLPEFPPETAPVIVVPKNPKAFHDVTARIVGPATATPETIKNVWWRVASGHSIDVFRLRIVDWKKKQATTDMVKEYVYEALDAAGALGAAKPMAIVQGGKKALRVARVAVDEDRDIAEYEITLYYWEEA